MAERLFKHTNATTAGAWQQITPLGRALVWAVAPRDPNRLIAAVPVADGFQILRSNDGGNTWPDRLENLEKMLMKANGAIGETTKGSGADASYRLSEYEQPSLLAIDPLDPDIIVAGGRDSGVFLSTDGGDNWRLLTDPFEGTLKDAADKQIPDLPRPRFAHFKHAGDVAGGALSLYIGTQGRGVWKIDVDFNLQPDSDEGGGHGNDTANTATQLDKTLNQTRTELTINDTTDVDYYKFTAQETGKLLVNLSFNGLRGLLDVEVRDSADAAIANTAAATDRDRVAEHINQKRVSIDVVKGKDYYIRVSSAKDPNPPGNSLEHTNHYNLRIQNLAQLSVELKGGDGIKRTDGIESVDGINTLRAAERINNWAISEPDKGKLNDTTGDIDFEKIGNPVGGSDIDTFVLSGTGAVTGSIDGGGHAGLNKVQFSAATNARVTSRNAGTGTGIGDGFRNVAALVGGANTDQFTLVGGVLRGSGTIDGGRR